MTFNAEQFYKEKSAENEEKLKWFYLKFIAHLFKVVLHRIFWEKNKDKYI